MASLIHQHNFIDISKQRKKTFIYYANPPLGVYWPNAFRLTLTSTLTCSLTHWCSLVACTWVFLTSRRANYLEQLPWTLLNAVRLFIFTFQCTVPILSPHKSPVSVFFKHPRLPLWKAFSEHCSVRALKSTASQKKLLPGKSKFSLAIAKDTSGGLLIQA